MKNISFSVFSGGGGTLSRLSALVVLVAGSVTGCAVGPHYQPPAPELPDRWHEVASDGLQAGQAEVAQWWRVFQDETLWRLIERAAQENLDVRIAVLRIRQARALRGAATGALLPSLDSQGGYRRSKGSANGPTAFPQGPGKAAQFANTVARGVAGQAIWAGTAAMGPGAQVVGTPVLNGLMGMLPTPSALPETEEVNLHMAGFDASWEIDIFGGIRRNIEAADAALEASVEDYRSTLVSLFGEVAATYIEIRTLQSEIGTTRRNIALQKEILELTQAKLAHDLATELDVRQAETILATTESQLPQLENALYVSMYRLGVLLGREPSALCDELAAQAPIPTPPEEVLVGVPADILRRRPDIRAAERRLAAQTAQIGVAVSALYPRFTLTGTFGFESTDLNHVLDARSITYGFGPSVRWNIFNGLQNLYRIAAQEAATREAYFVYRRTLLTALQEVESAMVAYKREQARRDALERAVKAARRSVELAAALYRNGLVDFQNVLDAQRSLTALENMLAQSRGQVAVNLVSLYKALGGGWSQETNPQYEYLEEESDVVDHPLDFFLTGGKTPLPWEDVSEEASETRGR